MRSDIQEKHQENSYQGKGSKQDSNELVYGIAHFRLSDGEHGFYEFIPRNLIKRSRVFDLL